MTNYESPIKPGATHAVQFVICSYFLRAQATAASARILVEFMLG
jgi:hypothetical protein